MPVAELIADLNRHLRGWAKYFSLGYPRRAFSDLNAYVRRRVLQHLKRRSQRGWRWPKGESRYHYLMRLGLVQL